MIHAKMVKPRWFPWNSKRVPEQINRLQDIAGDLTLNRDKIYEIGRVDLLGYRQKTPSLSGKFTQFENGAMATWYSLANIVNPSVPPNSVHLDDLVTTMTDFSAYETDDNNIFTGSIWFPKLRLAGFTLNIGDPDAILERNFNMVSEGSYILPDRYFAYQSVLVSGPGVETLLLAPAATEYALGKYIFRVLRVRAGVVSELLNDQNIGLEAADTYRYNPLAGTVLVQTCLLGDFIKVYYESATAYDTTWTDNNTEEKILLAEYCEVYMKVGTSTRLHKLQSLGIDVSFERTDYKEIGSNEIVQTGVKNKTVKISLSRFTEGFSLEEILAGDTTYKFIDPSNFSEDIQIMVKIFGEKEHTNFKIGYLMNKISPTAIGNSQAINDYNKSTTALECDNLIISDLESEIVFA